MQVQFLPGTPRDKRRASANIGKKPVINRGLFGERILRNLDVSAGGRQEALSRELELFEADGDGEVLGLTVIGHARDAHGGADVIDLSAPREFQISPLCGTEPELGLSVEARSAGGAHRSHLEVVGDISLTVAVVDVDGFTHLHRVYHGRIVRTAVLVVNGVHPDLGITVGAAHLEALDAVTPSDVGETIWVHGAGVEGTTHETEGQQETRNQTEVTHEIAPFRSVGSVDGFALRDTKYCLQKNKPISVYYKL